MIKRALERSAHGSFQNLIWCRGNSVELRQDRGALSFLWLCVGTNPKGRAPVLLTLGDLSMRKIYAWRPVHACRFQFDSWSLWRGCGFVRAENYRPYKLAPTPFGIRFKKCE